MDAVVSGDGSGGVVVVREEEVMGVGSHKHLSYSGKTEGAAGTAKQKRRRLLC